MSGGVTGAFSPSLIRIFAVSPGGLRFTAFLEKLVLNAFFLRDVDRCCQWEGRQNFQDHGSRPSFIRFLKP